MISGAPINDPLGFGEFDGAPLTPIGPPTLTTWRDPATKDHEIDESTLQIRATTRTRSRVWNVIQTFRRSSLRLRGGINVPRKIGDSFDQQLATEVRTALSREIQDGVIQLINVVVRRKPIGAVLMVVTYRDTQTGTPEELEFANAA